jgi:hypothetical protein
MIHVHRWSRWHLIRGVKMSDGEGNHWQEDTQQRQCRICGKIKVRFLA